MEQHNRGSEWKVFCRCLAILQRLLKGPAKPAELIEAVREKAGEEAYPRGEKAMKAAFKHDRVRLRRELGVNFTFDSQGQVYRLVDPGPYGCLELSTASLMALRLLSETFAGHVGELAELQTFLEELTGRLSPSAQRSLESSALPIDLDVFQAVDPEPLSQKVWDAVSRAVNERRKLGFNYLSPRHPDRRARYHEVAPYRIRYQRGHWYLYAYDLYRRSPSGAERYDDGHKRFRLQYIQEDERLRVLPTRITSSRRRPPRYETHYLLLPALGRGGISRHFEQMRVERYPDGRAEVWGYTSDEWEAARILLGYGENCIVLGGPEVLARVRQAVRGMAVNYELLE